MKLNKTLSTVIATIFAASFMLFSSCSSTPNIYQEEIEDVVTCNVAALDYMLDLMSGPDANVHLAAFENESHILLETLAAIEEEWIDDEKATYHDILVDWSTDNDEYAETCANILEYYNSTNIVLSDYHALRASSDSKKWSFTEKETDIEFIFEHHDNDTWECYPLDASVDEYMLNNIN